MKDTSSIGILTVLTGPSGVGKGSLVKKILERHNEIWLSVSATTRHPREGEKYGEHYFFFDQKEFKDLIEKDGFLEWAKFAGNFYGTPKKEVCQKLSNGNKVLLEIELEGARQIRKSFPEGVQIFIAPPNLEELEKRIRGRGTESEESINARLNRAKKEMQAMNEFDFVIINDDLNKALLKLEETMKLI